MPEIKEYIADYGNWHFESYWNEYTESWSVYQAEKREDGYKPVCHCFMAEPIKTTEDAKQRVEAYLEALPILEKLAEDESED